MARREAATAARGGIGVTLELPREPFKVGDKVRLALTTDRAGFLQVYAIESDGTKKCLIPNEHAPVVRLEAGKKVELPGAEHPFDLNITEPFGYELLKAVVTTGEVPWKEIPGPEELLKTVPHELGVRKGEFGEAVAAYLVRP